MGIYDRDYERAPGGGWGGGGGFGGGGGGFEPRMPTSANGRLLLTIVGCYVAQILFKPTFTDFFELTSDWVTAQPWRAYGLVTYSLLHSTGNIFHILFNGLVLFFFGRTIEGRLGGREYLTFFFTGAAFAGLVWTGAEFFVDHTVEVIGPDGAIVPVTRIPVLVGASGGIAAVMVLFALWYPKATILIWGVLPAPAWAVVGFGLLMDAMGAFRSFENGGAGSNVAFTAHLGGALLGYLYYRGGWRLSQWLPGAAGDGGGIELAKLFKRRPNLKIHRDDDEEAPDPVEDRVDAILRKIQAQGQDSLTRDERRVLEQASRRYQKRQR